MNKGNSNKVKWVIKTRVVQLNVNKYMAINWTEKHEDQHFLPDFLCFPRQFSNKVIKLQLV